MTPLEEDHGARGRDRRRASLGGVDLRSRRAGQSTAIIRAALKAYHDARERDFYPVSRKGDVEASIRVILNQLSVHYSKAATELEAQDTTDRSVDEANDRMRAQIQEGRKTSLTRRARRRGGALVFTFLVTSDIVRRLGHLAGVAAAVKAGDTKQRARLGGGDELGVLATSFDAMLDELAENVATERKNRESWRRRCARTAGSSRRSRRAI